MFTSRIVQDARSFMTGSGIHPSRGAWPKTNAPRRRSGVCEQSCKTLLRRANGEEIAVADRVGASRSRSRTMSLPEIYADFQNLDRLNRLRLTCRGTREALD